MKKFAFLCGVFLLCMCVLMLQIIQTRILSVTAYYYLAFFAISMAMFGMTAGALAVYFKKELFNKQNVSENLSWISAAFAISVALGVLFQISTVTIISETSIVLSALLWLKMVAILAPPFFFAGMGVSVALTRSPFPVGLVYGVDLCGAAFGCLAVLALLSVIDGESAMFAVAATGALAAVFFTISTPFEGSKVTLPWPSLSRSRLLRHPAKLLMILAALTITNAASYPYGLKVAFVKGAAEATDHIDFLQWNSFSRVMVRKADLKPPSMWGASEKTPKTLLSERYMTIDGLAGTAMYKFSGNLEDIEFLKYDITNMAYYVRSSGRAAVIGVGGGRDILSAYLFGFRDVTGIEINPMFIDLLKGRYRDYNMVASLPGVALHVDEARSWFARSMMKFDLIQMSLIDSWAATGAGAFSLTENALYTIEGWKHFIARLSDNGILTVSRWYAPDDVNETGRLVSLASASLLAVGVPDPRPHLFLVATDRLATLLLARAPFTATEIASLVKKAEELGFHVLIRPDVAPTSPILRQILAARDWNAMKQLAHSYYLDVSPPTDERPFFFNQLRWSALFDPTKIPQIKQLLRSDAPLRGNLLADITLAIIVTLSAGLVTLVVLIPSLPTVRPVRGELALWGTLYFLLIGLGFMFVEIGLIQRMSIFLGHPNYGLAIALFGIILMTGVGSLISERVPLASPQSILLWSLVLGSYVFVLPHWFPNMTARFESGGLLARTCVCLLAIVPLGLLMGFGFPTGMRIVNRIDDRPTPWFWAVNGAAGVLAAGVGVAISVEASINFTLITGAICYLLLGPVAFFLFRRAKKRSVAIAG